MAKKFDPATLFEPRLKKLDRTLVPYANERAELDAVKAGKKPLVLYSSQVGALASGAELQLWLREVVSRGLVITFGNAKPIGGWSFEDQPIEVYIARPEELWRVPALRALDRTAFVDGRWSDASENLKSDLLGYTAAQRKQWIGFQRADRPAWTCGTIYALLDAAQRMAVESVGRRCLGTTDVTVGITLLHDRSYSGIKRDALRRIPRGLTLARAGLRWAEFKLLFGSFESIRATKKRVLEVEVPKRLASKINGALTSNVQFLTKRGWA